MGTWYIVRHADKETGDFYNSQLNIQDAPISQKGKEQARKLITYFADKDISRIYVSAYQRTMQSATPLAEHLNLLPIVDERVNEINNGLFSRVPEQELSQRFPKEWQAFRERQTDFRFPEGETGEEAQKRIVSFLNEKRQIHTDENILVFCHDGLIRLMMCHVTNNPVTSRWNFYVDFCGITEIVYQREYEAWKLIRFNQTCA